MSTHAPGEAATVRLSDVRAERVAWLWPLRLPLGKLVVLDGDPSVGKSTIAIDLAARVSAGLEWPDGALCPRGSVVLMSAEDGLADTIRPRLDAAGGDASKVYALTEVSYCDDVGKPRSRSVTLADVEHIESAVKNTGAVLVIVDVVMAYLPSRADSHRDQDVRGVLAPLAAMAERRGCCVLLLRHLNKASGGSPLYRGGGSIGIIGAARVGLLAAHDPENDDRRVLAGVKANLSQMPAALSYRLVDSPEHGCARVEWLGKSEHTASALLAAPRDEDERSTRDEAAGFIRGYLVDSGGEAAARDVLKAGHGAGFSERTLQDARKRTSGLTTARRGFGKGAVWVWSIDAPIAAVGASLQSAAPMTSMGAPMDAEQPTATEDDDRRTVVPLFSDHGPTRPSPGHPNRDDVGDEPARSPGNPACQLCGRPNLYSPDSIARGVCASCVVVLDAEPETKP